MTSPSPYIRKVIRCANGDYVNPHQVTHWGVGQIAGEYHTYAIFAEFNFNQAYLATLSAGPVLMLHNAETVVLDAEHVRREARLCLDLLMDRLLDPSIAEVEDERLEAMVDMGSLVIETTGREASDAPRPRPEPVTETEASGAPEDGAPEGVESGGDA